MRKILVFVVALSMSIVARAHDPKLSGIGFSIENKRTKIAVQVQLDCLQPSQPKQDLIQRLDLRINGVQFVPKNPVYQVDATQRLAYLTAEYDENVESIDVGRRLFPETPDSRTIVSIRPGDAPAMESLLDASHNDFRWTLRGQPSRFDVARQFLSLGVTHIFSGIDHVLFILGLILVGGRLRDLLKTVTAFTIAHSITLSVAATGLWVPSSKYVEPIIALSIVFVAIENIRAKGDAKDYRAWIAFGFGLIHGFGFAGGVSEAGVPKDAMIWALAPFNIGVELAQTMIVLTVFPLLSILNSKKPLMSRRLVVYGSGVISLCGAFWFLERIGVISLLPLQNGLSSLLGLGHRF